MAVLLLECSFTYGPIICLFVPVKAPYTGFTKSRLLRVRLVWRMGKERSGIIHGDFFLLLFLTVWGWSTTLASWDGAGVILHLCRIKESRAPPFCRKLMISGRENIRAVLGDAVLGWKVYPMDIYFFFLFLFFTRSFCASRRREGISYYWAIRWDWGQSRAMGTVHHTHNIDVS